MAPRLAAPLLVVTNSTEYQRDRDLMIALAGDLVWDVDLRNNHVSERFSLNGVFGSPAKPRNPVLSAVVPIGRGELLAAKID